MLKPFSLLPKLRTIQQKPAENRTRRAGGARIYIYTGAQSNDVVGPCSPVVQQRRSKGSNLQGIRHRPCSCSAPCCRRCQNRGLLSPSRASSVPPQSPSSPVPCQPPDPAWGTTFFPSRFKTVKFNRVMVSCKIPEGWGRLGGSETQSCWKGWPQVAAPSCSP